MRICENWNIENKKRNVRKITELQVAVKSEKNNDREKYFYTVS